MIINLISQISGNDLNIPKGNLQQSNIDSVLAAVFSIFAAVTLIIITLAALKYIISQGNPQETAKAKNTIIYALVGLIMSVFAYAIVRFVIRGTQ